MAQIAVTAQSVRPVDPGAAIIRTIVTGEAIDVGVLAYVKSDGLAWKASGAAATTMQSVGICVSIGTEGRKTGAAGDTIALLMIGFVAGYTITAGAKAFTSDTAGQIADAAGTVTQILGYGWPNNILYFHPNNV